MADKCTRCVQDEAEWDFGDENLCQLCFEADCSESWWELCAPFWVDPAQVK